MAVTYAIIRVKILNILKEPDIIVLYGDITNYFKLSNWWLYAFMKRQRLSLRCHTKISQKLPEQTKELLESFLQYVTRLKIEKSYEMSHIFNMDETRYGSTWPVILALTKPMIKLSIFEQQVTKKSFHRCSYLCCW